jgi:hypothetical protein
MEQSKSNKEITIKELFQIIKEVLLPRWLSIIIIGLIGGVLGVAYAVMQPMKYTARLTFVVEETKSSGGGLASLAGQFGFDLGGGGGGSVFSGDNILLFLESGNLVREVLLTRYEFDSSLTLADHYAIVNKLNEGWEKNPAIGKVSFTKYGDLSLPRKEDSLMQGLVKRIINQDLVVARPDKKASFIEVKVSTRDEGFSQSFAQKLVTVAAEKYIDSKVRTKAINVQKLQDKADSLSLVLNNKTYRAASSQQNLVDMNPGVRTAPIEAEINTREKSMAATLFAEVVKNLELSKTLLSQETPVIQIVDQSRFPLQKEKPSKSKSLVLFSFIGVFIWINLLFLRKIFFGK